MKRSPPRPLAWVLAALVTALTVNGAHGVWSHAAHLPAIRAADALPVYLSAAAVIDGEDPTTQQGLKAAYDHRHMTVRAATFSNLYPASTGVLVQPIATGTWEDFVPRWRGLLLLGALLAGAGAGFASVRGAARPLAVAVGAWIAVGAFPVTSECIALGQANLLVGGLLGLAMAALATGAGGLAGVAAIVGAAIKLVPGIVALPLLAARRWRALLLMTGAGLGVAAVTLAHVPLDRIIAGLRATLEFQSTITPNWMNRGPTPRWMQVLGDVRHTPMMLWTLILLASTAWGTRGIAANHLRRGPPPGPAAPAELLQVLPAGVALATAWLGADAAAFHVLYAPLYIPALVYVALWPLDRAAPRWAWLMLPVAALPTLLYGADLPTVGEEARLVLAGLMLWGLTALRLLWHSPRLPWLAVLALATTTGWGLARANRFGEVPRGPAPDQVEDIRGYGLPDGVGHGGPQPGLGPDPMDGSPEDAGARLLLEEVIAADTANRLTSHFVQAPAKWGAVDDPLAQRLSRTAPLPPAALVTYDEAARWLAWERYAIDQLPQATLPADEWRRMWRTLSTDPGR